MMLMLLLFCFVVVVVVVDIVDVLAHQERQGHAATAAPSLLPAAGSHPPPLLFHQPKQKNE